MKKLTWPFRGEVQIGLKSRDGVGPDYVRTIRFSDQTDEWVGRRVAGCDQSKRGWGDPAFLPHNDLHKYIENDTIHFIIDISLS